MSAQFQPVAQCGLHHPDVRRFFMLIPEVGQLVLNSAALGEPGKLYVLKIGEQVKVVDLARDLIRLAGFVPDRDIPISFIGLRPGEKLFEELVGADERASQSRCDEIMEVAPVGRIDRIALASWIVGLEQRARQNDAAAVMDYLGTLVPAFRQNRERLPVGPEGRTVGIPEGDSPATGTTASHAALYRDVLADRKPPGAPVGMVDERRNRSSQRDATGV